MASFSISSYTDTSVTIRVTGITSGQTIRFYIRTDPSDGNDIDKSYTSTSTSISKTFSGLEPDTYYVCNVKVDSDAWLGAKGFTTDPEQPDIDLWSWTSSNGSATSTQTRNAYSAITSHGKLSSFSYKVWNDMVDKVSEIRDVFGYSSWSSQYLSYSNTLMTSSSKELTAARFNSLRYNIGSHYSTGIPEVSKGDTVYGSYFVTLMQKANDWIERGY